MRASKQRGKNCKTLWTKELHKRSQFTTISLMTWGVRVLSSRSGVCWYLQVRVLSSCSGVAQVFAGTYSKAVHSSYHRLLHEWDLIPVPQEVPAVTLLKGAVLHLLNVGSSWDKAHKLSFVVSMEAVMHDHNTLCMIMPTVCSNQSPAEKRAGFWKSW